MLPEWFERATARGETGALARGVDWSATSLGHPAGWPLALRSAVETCFATDFPMLVVWGPDLVKIYNDGYRQILGPEKHPRAMGAPARVIWPELWDTIGPLFESTITTGEPALLVDQQLFIERDGLLEETFFTYCYSPLRDETRVVRGVLDTVIETTEGVVGRRRLRCVTELATRLHAVGGDVADTARAAEEVLRRHDADLRSAMVLLNPGTGSGEEGALLRTPLVGPGGGAVLGELVMEPSPHRPVDDAYRAFVGLVASTIGAALHSAARRVEELTQLRRVGESLQRAMLPTIDSADVAVRYVPATRALAIGGDWYDVLDLDDGRTALIVGDCVGHGLDAASAMGQLRSASRALLLERRGPAAVLEALDRFAESVPGAEATTVFCAVVDGGAGTVTYASAGHPPPALAAPDGVTWLDEATSPPLAVQPLERVQACRRVEPGDTLLLYTDGLVERRGESLDTGFARLGRALAEVATLGSLDEVADRLLGALVPDGGADDVAVVVHRVAGRQR